MHHAPVKRHAPGRLVLLLLVALVVCLAVAAAPAVAAPAPTTLTLTARSLTVSWGATAILNGTLRTTANPPLPVDQQMVMVEYTATPNDPNSWVVAAHISNTPAQYGTGQYTYNFPAERSYYWRMDFAGTADWAASTSTFLSVKIAPLVGKPSCPSSIKAKKKFTVSGSLRPRFTAGAKTVKVKAYVRKNHKWKFYKAYDATNANANGYTKYSVRLSIAKKGKYRFNGVTAATSDFAAATSPWSQTLSVK